MTSVYNYPQQQLRRNRSLSTGALKQPGISQISLGYYAELNFTPIQTQPYATNYFNYNEDLNSRLANSNKVDPHHEPKLLLTSSFSTRPNSPSPVSRLSQYETDSYSRRYSPSQSATFQTEYNSRSCRLRSQSCSSNTRYVSHAPNHMFVRQPIASGNDSGFDSGDSELTSYNYNISNISSYYVPSRTPLSLGSPPSSPPNHNPLLSSLYNPNAYRFQLNRSTGPDQEQFSSNSGSLSRTRKSEEKLRRTLGIDETEIPTISPTITVPSPHLSKTLTSSNSSTEYYTDSMEHPKTRKMSEGLTFLEKLKTVAAEKCEHSKRRQQHKQGKKSLEVVTKRSLILLPETVDLEHTDTLIHAEPDRMVWPMDIQPPVSGVQKLMDLY